MQMAATNYHSSNCCFKNVKRLPTKYEDNTNSWMTTKMFEDFLTELDRKLGAENRKILLFIDHYAAHPKNNTSKLYPLNC
jgi:hypothetical protein